MPPRASGARAALLAVLAGVGGLVLFALPSVLPRAGTARAQDGGDQAAALAARVAALEAENAALRARLATDGADRELDRAIIATIDGEPLTRRDLSEACLRAYGRAYLETFLNEALVRQEARRVGLEVTSDEADRWASAELDRYAAAAGGEDRLAEQLARQSLDLPGYRAILRNNAEVALLVIELTRRRRSSEEGLRQAWDDRYGPKIELRHALWAVPDGASKDELRRAEERAKAALDKVRLGADFGKIAEGESADRASAKRLGLIGTVTRRQLEGAWPALVEPAFASSGAGLVPNVVRGARGFHIVQVLKKIPAGKPFEEVRAALAAELATAEPTAAETNEVLVELRGRYTIERRWP